MKYPYLLGNSMYLAWTDTKARYRRSVLGPLWLTIGNLIGIVGLGVVWGSIMNEDLHTFLPSLAVGMVLWQFIAGVVGEAPSAFVSQAAMIRNVAIPPWFFVVRALSRHCINLLHNMTLVVGVLAYAGIWPGLDGLLAIPALALLVLNLYWITHLLGLLGARLRDLQNLVSALLPLLFFASPVIFRIDRLPVSMQAVWFNPMSHFIESVRAPLMGGAEQATHLMVSLAVLVTGSAATLLLQRAKGHKLAFWV